MRRSLPYVVAIVLLMLALIGVIWFAYAHAAAEQQLRDSGRTRAALEALVRDLSAPSEAILIDDRTLEQIADLRSIDLERLGHQAFLPYESLAADDDAGDESGTGAALAEAGLPIELADDLALTPEAWFIRRAAAACDRVTRLLSPAGADEPPADDPLAGALVPGSAAMECRVVPRLEHLARAWWPGLSVRACRALIATGKRSGSIRERLIQIGREHPDFAGEAMELLRRFDLPPAATPSPAR